MSLPGDLQPILDTLLDGGVKGFPSDRPATRLGDVGGLGLRVTAGDVDFPAAVLRRSALEHNAGWMREFVRRSGAILCPHGKTTMAPQLFHRQLADGAWGITLATLQQVRVAYRYGVRRILLANQLLAPGGIAWVQEALDADPGLDFTCLVDGPGGCGPPGSLRPGPPPHPGAGGTGPPRRAHRGPHGGFGPGPGPGGAHLAPPEPAGCGVLRGHPGRPRIPRTTGPGSSPGWNAWAPWPWPATRRACSRPGKCCSRPGARPISTWWSRRWGRCAWGARPRWCCAAAAISPMTPATTSVSWVCWRGACPRTCARPGTWRRLWRSGARC